MQQNTVTYKYVHQYQQYYYIFISRLSVKISKRSPDILRAFCLIKDFCFTERITKNCIAIALAVVLMFPEHRLKSTRLVSLTILLVMLLAMLLDCLNLLFEKQYFASLFEYLNQCITLSCCKKRITLLLYNTVFESNISCNLIKAYLFGIRKVLKLIAYNSSIFVCLITAQNSIISVL